MTDGVIGWGLLPPKEPPVDISCIKVMLSGIMLLLVGIFFYVADGTGIYMDISSLCFLGGILAFVVGLLIPWQMGNAIVSDSLPQKTCPQCGKPHDFDYPKCPHGNYDYYG